MIRDLRSVVSDELGKRRGKLIGVLLLVLIAFPYLPISSYYSFMLMLILTFGLAATAFNVLLGYTGLLSFGHAAFFGTGAYSVAMLMMYTSINEFFVLLLVGIYCTFVVSAVIGYISVRHTEVYYTLLMLALAHVMYVVSTQAYGVTRGSDGLSVSPPTIVGVDVADLVGYTIFLNEVYYYLLLCTVVFVVGVLWVLMNSPFGLALKTIRDSSTRAEAIGIPVIRYRWYATIVSGTATGISGVLFVFLNGHVTPESGFHWFRSGEIALMAVLGGPSAFFGPLVGAGVFVVLQTIANTFIPEYWQFLMGAVILTTVLFLPEGLLSLKDLKASTIPGSVVNTFRSDRQQPTESTDGELTEDTDD